MVGRGGEPWTLAGRQTFGWCWMHEFQMLAAAGYGVLYTNPRGGRGYGPDHARAIFRNWGDAPFEDLMAAVDHACALDWVDEDRLGVLGGSYGGYMTNWVITHTDRFAAACTQRYAGAGEWQARCAGRARFHGHDLPGPG